MSSSKNDNNFIINKLKDVIENKELQDKIKEKANNKLKNFYHNSEQHKQFYKEKNIDIIQVEFFGEETIEEATKKAIEKAIETVADSINKKISKLKSNETKKILIDCNNGDHMIGIVIGKTKDNKSYIFLDRENESGRYLGGSPEKCLSGLLFKKLNVDRIIPIPTIQSDRECCYVYSYLLLEVFTSKDTKVQNLIDKAFNKRDKIYRGDEKTQNTNGQNIVDIKELPLLMQILYQRQNSVLKERLEENLFNGIVNINKRLLENIKFDVLTENDIKKQESTQKNLGNDFDQDKFCNKMKSIMKKRATTNHILPFLTTIAYVDMNKFIEITNGLCMNKTEKQITKKKKILKRTQSVKSKTNKMIEAEQNRIIEKEKQNAERIKRDNKTIKPSGNVRTKEKYNENDGGYNTIKLKGNFPMKSTKVNFEKIMNIIEEANEKKNKNETQNKKSKKNTKTLNKGNKKGF